MSALIVGSLTPLACGSSRDTVAKPFGATGDASDGLVRRDDSMEIPCEERRILMTVCQQCHTRPETKNGAPFPLQWRSDILASYGGVEIRRLMIEQLQVGRMPLAPVTIDPSDRPLLLAWLESGAPAVTPRTCENTGGTHTAPHDASTPAPEDSGVVDAGAQDDSATAFDGGDDADGQGQPEEGQ